MIYVLKINNIRSLQLFQHKGQVNISIRNGGDEMVKWGG